MPRAAAWLWLCVCGLFAGDKEEYAKWAKERQAGFSGFLKVAALMTGVTCSLSHGLIVPQFGHQKNGSVLMMHPNLCILSEQNGQIMPVPP